MIVLPGLINGHIHLWQTALRGVAADWTLDHYFGVLIGQVVKLKSDTNMRAAADPVSSIVLHAGVSNVDTVMVRGKLVKQHGNFCIGTLIADCRSSIVRLSVFTLDLDHTLRRLSSDLDRFKKAGGHSAFSGLV